jgi:hypothetical protein
MLAGELGRSPNAMSRYCSATWLLFIALAAGCSVSEPAPLNGVAVTYDGVEFTSVDFGVEYNSANFNRDVPLVNVTLVLPDGFEVDPLSITPDLLREHGLEVHETGNYGTGDFDFSVEFEGLTYESLQGKFENNRVKSLTLMPGYGNTTTCIKIRNEAVTLPVRGDDLKNLFGAPDATRQYSYGPART